MGIKEDKTIKNIVQAVRDSDAKKTKGYDTQATVTRVEDGVAWVHIPGGVSETPAKLTIDAKEGDSVMVRVAGGRAFLLGNATNPPTDDATARKAFNSALDAVKSSERAYVAAESAEASAETAREAAAAAKATTDEINEYAETAGKTVTQILDDGEKAGAAAQKALVGLATVEDVVGVVNWMRTHGNYSAATETEVLDGTFYFTVATVSSPTGNPRQNMYYELTSGTYTLTMDTTVDSQKTYYTLTQVTPPEGADPSALGYVKMTNLEDVVSNYVNTHLALTDEGLWLVPGDTPNANKVLIATGGAGHTYETAGTYILGEDDSILASFGETVSLGEKQNLVIDQNGISLKDWRGVLQSMITSQGIDYYGIGKVSSSEYDRKPLIHLGESGLRLVDPKSYPEKVAILGWNNTMRRFNIYADQMAITGITEFYDYVHFFGRVVIDGSTYVDIDDGNIYSEALIGTVQMYAGTTAPNGWFICDGRSLDKNVYDLLFDVIGYTYGGSGDNFNIPDLRGRMPVGAGQGTGLTNRPLAEKGGAEGIQAHKHSVETQPKFTIPNHQHSLQRQQLGITTGSTNRYFASGTTVGGNTANDGGGGECTRTTNTAVGGVSNLPSGQSTGDSGNMSPYLGINFIIHAGVPTV